MFAEAYVVLADLISLYFNMKFKVLIEQRNKCPWKRLILIQQEVLYYLQYFHLPLISAKDTLCYKSELARLSSLKRDLRNEKTTPWNDWIK